jgi:hypothetical protein
MLLNLDLDHYKQLNDDKTGINDTVSPELNRPFDIYMYLSTKVFSVQFILLG